MLKTIQILTWSLISILLVGVGFISFHAIQNQQKEDNTFLFGGAFNLINQDGIPVDETLLFGKPHVLFFGFTHCPEVCPTSLYELSNWIDALGHQADNIVFAFITVDPQRDTPEFLKEYVNAFSAKIIALTGTEDQIAHMAKLYGIFYEKMPLEGDAYTMNHTASFYLMRADGSFQGTISYGEDSKTALQKLQRLATTQP